MAQTVRRSGWLMVFVLAASGCAAPIYPVAAGRNPYQPRPYGPAVQLAPAPSPIGRWDAVMMLDPGTPVRALTADGMVTAGAFVSATLLALTIESASRVTVAAAD